MLVYLSFYERKIIKLTISIMVHWPLRNGEHKVAMSVRVIVSISQIIYSFICYFITDDCFHVTWSEILLIVISHMLVPMVASLISANGC